MKAFLKCKLMIGVNYLMKILSKVCFCSFFVLSILTTISIYATESHDPIKYYFAFSTQSLADNCMYSVPLWFVIMG